jgi:hypothetical protein
MAQSKSDLEEDRCLALWEFDFRSCLEIYALIPVTSVSSRNPFHTSVLHDKSLTGFSVGALYLPLSGEAQKSVNETQEFSTIGREEGIFVDTLQSSASSCSGKEPA